MPETNESLFAFAEEFQNLFSVTPELKAKGCKELKDQLEITPGAERSFVIAVATHQDKTRNTITRISCKKGIPLGGYVYDLQNDSYVFECSDYYLLGYVPISFIARFPNLSWEMRLPVPEIVMRKYLTPMQKKELKNFKNHFPSTEYKIELIQMVDANS